MEGIAQDLKTKLDSNQRTIFITDADELLAVWRLKRQSSTMRSKNLSMVQTRWRMSAPPNEKALLKPCHVSIRRKAGQTFSKVDLGSTMDCHGHGQVKHISIDDLDSLEAVSLAKRNIAPYISPILDSGTLALACKDLGIAGKAIPKVIKGRQYIAFSGYAGLRTYFPGTIYSANNRKIITMAIGALGIRNMVKTGGILTICLTVPLTVLEAFLADYATCYDLAGELAAELFKIGASSVLGAVAGIWLGGFTTAVFWPIATAILIGVFTGGVLNHLDDNYQLSEKLSAILEDMSKKIEKSGKNAIYDAQRSAYSGLGGFIRSQGYGGPF